MYINLFCSANTPPTVSLHEDILKIDMGPVILETDVIGFTRWVESILVQAINLGINLKIYK